MTDHQNFMQLTGPDYCGRILSGDFSPRLKMRVAQCIRAFKTFEAIGGPGIPYMAAWKEEDGAIWYEHAAGRFCEIMGCTAHELASVFPGSIIDRRVYGQNSSLQTISRLELTGGRNRIRDEGKKTGISESVFKVAPHGSDDVWLKDQAIVETFAEDNVCLSIGCLAIVTKEMEADEKRRQAEMALMRSERKYRLTFEHAASLIVLADADGTILDCNGRITRYLGYTPDQAMGWPMTRLIHKDYIKEYRESVNRALKEGFFSGVGLVFVKSNGEFLDANVNFSALADKDGHSIRVVCIIEDITQKKQMEEELERARKLEATGILAGGIAHDYNNLLTVIIGNIDLSMMDRAPNDPGIQVLSAAKEAAIRSFRLTNKFITFSQGGSPVKKTIGVKDILEDSIREFLQDSMRLALVGSGLRCESYFEPGLWKVCVDKDQIRQVFLNILTNAKEAMPNGGTLMVRAQNLEIKGNDHQNNIPAKSGMYVEISFEDQGTGIRPEDLNKIFDPYFSTKDRGSQKGMGLGLSIAYSVIKKHDGFIQARPNPEQGTIFRIYLPISRS